MRNRITYLKFKEAFREYPIISTKDINKTYPEMRKRSLHEWVEKGYLKRIIKSYYTPSDKKVDEFLIYYTANKIYDPSYISLQSALNYYGLIPEFVPQITSVSSKKTTVLKTNFSNFIYSSIKESLFFGYDLITNTSVDYRVKMAYPEKALLDFFYLNPDVDNEDRFYELRINPLLFKEKFNLERFNNYLTLYNVKSLNRRANKFLEYIKNA